MATIPQDLFTQIDDLLGGVLEPRALATVLDRVQEFGEAQYDKGWDDGHPVYRSSTGEYTPAVFDCPSMTRRTPAAPGSVTR